MLEVWQVLLSFILTPILAWLAIITAVVADYDWAPQLAKDGAAVSAAVEPVPMTPIWPQVLNDTELKHVLRLAEWPENRIDGAISIVWCESRNNTQAVGDNGQSLGMFQLNTMWWAYAGEDISHWDDPVVNARVALAVYGYLGRWGGGGGWSCARIMGLH